MSSENIDELKKLWKNDELVKIRSLISKDELDDLEQNQTIVLSVSLMKIVVEIIENYCNLLGISMEYFLEYSVMSMLKTVLHDISKLKMYENAKMPIQCL